MWDLDRRPRVRRSTYRPFSRPFGSGPSGAPAHLVEWITDRIARSWPGRITSELAAVSGPVAAKDAGVGHSWPFVAWACLGGSGETRLTCGKATSLVRPDPKIP